MAVTTIFLIKDGITNHYEIINDVDSRPVMVIRDGRTLIGRLFVERSHPHPPKWLSYFGDNEELSDLKLVSASASAVLLVKRETRIFAVVFGYGRYLLQDGVTESRFGLRVALNSVEPGQLRSIDHKRLDAVPRMTREQLSKSAGIDQFGLNVERDMLRALTGKPTDTTLGSQLSGADQLSVNGKVPLNELPSQLDRYLVLSKKKVYRSEFAWVDNIQEVSDRSAKAELDEALVAELSSDEEGAVWLSVPDMLDWSTVGGFQYSKGKNAEIFEDLELSEYFAAQRPRSELNPDNLRTDRIYLVDAESGGVDRSWSVYSCLLAELTLGKKRFVLNEGKWYEIDAEFLEEVSKAIAKLPSSKAPLPKALPGETEPDFNKRAFQQGGSAFALLDAKPIRYPGRGQVEVCDLYWSDKAFIHLKRYGASARLSHLFSQGVVSAQLFQSHPEFRKDFFTKLPESHKWGNPEEPVRTSDFEVAYAIIKKDSSPLNLPFFSKVNLRNAAAQLQSSGYRVTLTLVHTK